MGTGDVLGLLAVVVLVLANGFFVATEFAIVAVRRSRLEQLAAEGNVSARAAQDVVGRLDAYIAACQLGITMASLALGWIGEPAFAHLVEPPLEAIVGQFAPTASRAVAVGTSFAIITALHIVIGELAPKGLALQRPVGTTLWIARPIQIFYVLFRWPITLLNAVGNGVLRLVGLQPAAGHEMVHSVEELRVLVTASQAAGTVDASEARIAAHVFGFSELTAGELMTPRTEIQAIREDVELPELLALLAAGTHGRLIVYNRTIDDVVGVLHVRDMFQVLHRPPEAFSLKALIREPLVVPETKEASAVLDEMRAAHRGLAVVVDEYGGTAGILTIEDLVEAFVGRIDEDTARDHHAPPPAPALEDGPVLLDGLTRLGEFEEVVGFHLDEEMRDKADTLGGLVMATLDRIPVVGDEVTIGDRTLRVEAMDGRRVALVQLSAPADADLASGVGGAQTDATG